MLETLRNLFQTKFRTFLTILGIMVGAITLTVMGAMSEKISLLVEGALAFYNTRVIVQSQSCLPGGFFGSPLPLEIVEDIKLLPNVQAVFPSTYILYKERKDETITIGFDFPPLAKGILASRFKYEGEFYPVELYKGRFFGPEEHRVAVVGINFSVGMKLNVGEIFKIRGYDYKVVGIIKESLTIRDNIIFIPFREAQELLAELLAIPFSIDPYTLVSEIEVYPSDLKKASEIAKIINQRIKGVKAYYPGEIEEQYKQKLKIFTAITISNALIALLVGGLAISNTMMMAVSERTKEIGLKKAFGATNADIMIEFLTESTVIGFIGGILGLSAGCLIISLLNNNLINHGVIIFIITTRLIVVVFVFAVFMGAAAGVFPALIAARRNPIEALRAD